MTKSQFVPARPIGAYTPSRVVSPIVATPIEPARELFDIVGIWISSVTSWCHGRHPFSKSPGLSRILSRTEARSNGNHHRAFHRRHFTLHAQRSSRVIAVRGGLVTRGENGCGSICTSPVRRPALTDPKAFGL